MTEVYDIICIRICLEFEQSVKNKNWLKFLGNRYKSMTELKVTLLPHDQNIYYGVQKYDLYKMGGGVENIFRVESDIMLISKNKTIFQILPLENVCNLQTFLIQAFYTHAVQRHMIQLHSSIIEHNGRGLMFLGPSGIGKTTQAELWNKYRDALIINGDIVFVQETEEAFLGWGTPWHGSSPYCENTSVPVHAMIVLKQAPENSIRELTGFEKVSAVSNSVFYPQWLENGMELCLETLDHLLRAVPVYELCCRPDEDAVKLTEETVFGRS
jgi:hypothetical protein